MRAVRPALISLFMGSFASAAAGQDAIVARSAKLEFGNLHLVFAVDSGGIYLWANSPKAEGPKQYSTLLNPTEALTWVSEARRFLSQTLTNDDSGSMRTSAALHGLEQAGRVYLMRHKVGRDWTNERFLILQFKDSTKRPFVVSANDALLREILDSVEVIGREAPPFDPGIHHDPVKVDKPASLKPRQRPPAYPPSARANDREGVVVLRFVVGTDGKADMKTVSVLVTPGESFHRSVLTTLPKLLFEPATAGGSPVRQMVVMPFTFSLYRGRP